MLSLAQIEIDISETGAVFETVGSEASFLGPIFYQLVGVFIIGVIIVAGLYLIRYYIQKKARSRKGPQEMVVLRVSVPKHTKDDKGGQEPSLQQIQEDVGVVETFFASIGGLKPEKGFKAWLYGREDHLSFEIVSHDGLISFYISTPERMRANIEQQLHAQFPDAQIDEVDDYNIFSPQGVIVGSYLTFKRQSIFPIKNYTKLESDPLNAITNALSKVPKGDGAAIQYVVRSAKKDWRKLGVKVASEMQQGKKLDDVIGGKDLKLFKSMKKMAFTKPDDKGPGDTRKLSPLEEEMVKGIEEKASSAGLDVNIRIVVSSKNIGAAQATLNNITNSFSQFSIYQYGNTFQKEVPRFKKKLINSFIYREFDDKYGLVLNTEEMASVWHLPLSTTETPNIRWLDARTAPAPENIPNEGMKLGYNEYRGVKKDIYIKRGDRRRHMYIIGKSGSGKSWTMANMIIQDIQNGDGVGVVDPHGELVEQVLCHIPKDRVDDVIVFNPSDMDRPIGLNMLEAPTEDMKDFAVQEMISIFYKLFPPEMIGPMFEHNMRNVMLTLMADDKEPGTIAEIPRMFSDDAFSKMWVAKLKDPVVRAFWEQEMAKTSDFHKSEMLGYLISKVGRFVENTMMRNIIGQNRSGFDFSDVMDNQKILLVNLSKGTTGEVNSNLLGMIIVTKLQMAALARTNIAEEDRKDFYLYLDEFQNVITPSIATILSEARKYKLDLIMAHQYMGQLVDKGDTMIRDAVLGNVGSMLVSRIGVEDAEMLEKEFAPTFIPYDMVNNMKYTWVAKILIDNTTSRPFNLKTYPVPKGNRELAEAIKEMSRLKYGRDRKIVEAEIAERTQLGKAAPTADAQQVGSSL